jgi:hypothetical protein
MLQFCIDPLAFIYHLLVKPDVAHASEVPETLFQALRAADISKSFMELSFVAHYWGPSLRERFRAISGSNRLAIEILQE